MGIEKLELEGLDINIEAVAKDENEIRTRHESNREAWNEGAVRYSEELAEAIQFLREGKSNLHPVERRNLAKLGTFKDWCQTAIHLQCASGKDTLSLWNEGVRDVVGVDISDVHIENARQTSGALNAPARWYRCDILDTPEELNSSADLVYTGRGALCWLHDLEGWAKVVCRLLKRGGAFHILDDHTVSWLFDQDAEVLEAYNLNYFAHAESNQGWSPSYIGDLGKPVNELATKYERLWPISYVVQALINAGLVIEYLGEHHEPYWDAFPKLKPEYQTRIPMTFSILARRPE